MCTKRKIKLLLLIVFHTLYLSRTPKKNLRFTLYMYSLRSVFALAQNFMGPCLKLIIYFISFLNLVNNTRVKQDLQWKKKNVNATYISSGLWPVWSDSTITNGNCSHTSHNLNLKSNVQWKKYEVLALPKTSNDDFFFTFSLFNLTTEW